MSNERVLQIAQLVLDTSKVKHIFCEITFGNCFTESVFLQDYRTGKSETYVFCADGRKTEDKNGIHYIEDNNLDAAEAHLRQVLEGVTV